MTCIISPIFVLCYDTLAMKIGTFCDESVVLARCGTPPDAGA